MGNFITFCGGNHFKEIKSLYFDLLKDINYSDSYRYNQDFIKNMHINKEKIYDIMKLFNYVAVVEKEDVFYLKPDLFKYNSLLDRLLRRFFRRENVFFNQGLLKLMLSEENGREFSVFKKHFLDRMIQMSTSKGFKITTNLTILTCTK